jgi:hypothetical protein
MQKMVLLPYDRYQRLLSSSQEDSNNVKGQKTATQEVIPSGQTTPLKPEGTEETSDAKVSENIEKLLRSFPRTLQGRARALLAYIVPHLSWNEIGEVIIAGEKIPKSNIVDLVRVQLKDYKDFRPAGLEQFNLLLEDINVPLSLLTTSRRDQTGEGNIPPPPGSPVKRKRDSSTIAKVKWLKL